MFAHLSPAGDPRALDVRGLRPPSRTAGRGRAWTALAAWLALVLAAEALPATASPAPPPLTAAQADLVLVTILRAPDHGLDAEAFLGAADTARARSADPAAHERARAAAPGAVVALAGAQHGQRLPPGAFPPDWAIRPAAYDGAADLAAALAQGRLESWLAGLPPPDPRYGRLVRALARYGAIAQRGGWPTLARRPALGLGDTGEAVEALRQRLALEDAAVTPMRSPDPAGRRSDYDVDLAAAVMRAQARYGLTPDGKAGPATIDALNVPAAARLAQLRANLERWRWAPRALPAVRLEVNTADASLELFDGLAPSMVMRAIVGRSDRATPSFADHVTAVVFNPPWNVPNDIAVKEIWPKIRRNPAYMTRERFVVRPGGGLQQLPGPKCALGAIKFDLSNSFGVYLHDTPAHSLFALDRRALSHGCMRLEDPTDLARRLLAGDANWPPTAINLALLSGKTVRAPLKSPTPVFVFYWTAFVDDAGQVQFRPDVYGWDAELARRMAAAGRTL